MCSVQLDTLHNPMCMDYALFLCGEALGTGAAEKLLIMDAQSSICP